MEEINSPISGPWTDDGKAVIARKTRSLTPAASARGPHIAMRFGALQVGLPLTPHCIATRLGSLRLKFKLAASIAITARANAKSAMSIAQPCRNVERRESMFATLFNYLVCSKQHGSRHCKPEDACSFKIEYELKFSWGLNGHFRHP